MPIIPPTIPSTGPPAEPSDAPPPACPVVIGALHLDLVARLDGTHHPAASNPVRFTASAGGVGANVARAIAAAGLPCRLIAPCGGEAASDPMLALPGVAIERVAVGGCEPGRYVAVLDPCGELVAGYGDMRACELAGPGALLDALRWRAATLCVVDANLSARAIAAVVAEAPAPIAAVAVSPVKARRLAPVATGIALSRERRLDELVRMPEATLAEVLPLVVPDEPLPAATVIDQVEIQAKYAGYLDRQRADIERARKHDDAPLPEALDYDAVRGLSNEVRQKFQENRPETVGQAARIAGVTPAAVSLLLVHLKKLDLRESA